MGTRIDYREWVEIRFVYHRIWDFMDLFPFNNRMKDIFTNGFFLFPIVLDQQSANESQEKNEHRVEV